MSRDDIHAAVVWSVVSLAVVALGSWLIVTLPERGQSPAAPATAPGEPTVEWRHWLPESLRP